MAQEEGQPAEESLREKATRGLNELMDHEMTKQVMETGKTAMETSKAAVRKAVGTKTSRQNRSESDISLSYMPLSYGWFMPTKSGFAGTWLISDRWSMEAEYLSGGYNLGFLGVDLFDLSERILALNARWYTANSFNLKFGVGERKYTFALGGDYLSRITDGEVTMGPSMKITNEVLVLGLGNRWQFARGFTFGFDWFELLIPIGRGRVEENILQNVEDKDDRDDIRNVYSAMRHWTTGNVLKLHVGYTF